jgi:hypothetical protein
MGKRWAITTRTPLLLLRLLLSGLFLSRAPQRLAQGTGVRHIDRTGDIVLARGHGGKVTR